MSSSTPISPVPAYEANPVQFPEKRFAAPAMQDTAVYGAATGQQHSGTTHSNYNQNPAIGSENVYSHQSVAPLASPAQQPQGIVPGKHEYFTPEQQSPQQLASPVQQPQGIAPGKHEYYNSEQQPQQQQQLHPQQPQQQQYQQTYQTAVPLGSLEEAGAPVDCPVCRHRALTVVEKASGNTVHLWAALACLVFCLGCVPYLIPGLKDVKHKCGHCGVLLAEWHRSGRTVVLQHA